MCLRRLASTPQHSVAGHQLQERPVSAVEATGDRAASMAWSAHRVEVGQVKTERFSIFDLGSWMAVRKLRARTVDKAC